MALKIATQYADTVAASLDYPHGSAKNVTGPTLTDGTPWEKAIIDDIQGLVQSLLEAGGVTPSGSADTVRAPQYLTAIVNLRWYEFADYEVGTEVVNSAGEKWTCIAPNGPASTVSDPGDAGGNRATYWQSAAQTQFDYDNPVGTIRITANNSNPGVSFGVGNWVRRNEGQAIVGTKIADPDFGHNDSGGSLTHSHAAGTLNGGIHSHAAGTLTAASHTHTVAATGWGKVQAAGALPEPSFSERLVTGSGLSEDNEELESLAHADGTAMATSSAAPVVSGTVATSNSTVTGSTASGSSLMPYATLYIWERTS